MTKAEKEIRDFCGHHADWWPSTTQVQEMLALAQPEQEPVEQYAKLAQHCAMLEHKMALIEQEPSQWRDMIVATLVREGINKHRARELADHFAAQPEPVACRFCFNEKGCWAWQCYSCGEIDDVQKHIDNFEGEER